MGNCVKGRSGEIVGWFFFFWVVEDTSHGRCILSWVGMGILHSIAWCVALT